MKRLGSRTSIIKQVMVLCLALALMKPSAAAQTTPPGGSDARSPQIALSSSVLDFGLVGVGRTSNLTLTVRNTGGGILKGVATVTAPFSIRGKSYALKSGQSQSVTVCYKPEVPGTNSGWVMFSGARETRLPVTAWAKAPPAPPGKLRFAEEAQSDFIVKYFTDQVSYLIKPPKKENIGVNQFQTPCDRKTVLQEAIEQPGRELAVVQLVHYPGAGSEETAKRRWISDLKSLRYKRLVFLRGDTKTMRADGLPVLDDVLL